MTELLAWNDPQAYANNAQEATKASERLTTSEFARNIVVVVLISTFLFLASIGAWLWYGAHRFQDCL
jgi:hypothetical protein